MNWRVISTLMLKDLKLYFANRFFALITGLGLVAFIGIYFLMPSKVDEDLELGLYMSQMPAVLEELLEDEEVRFLLFDSDQALQASVAAGDIPAGYSFPDGSLEKIVMGERADVDLYFSSDIPEEFKEVYAVILDEFAFVLSDQEVDIETQEIILGPDMAGAQVPPRARMLPLLTVFILMMETMGLASLITNEVETGTLQALLTTPLRVDGLFVAKGLFGTLFAFSQTLLLIGITGGLGHQPVLILVSLLLGAALVTGVAFLMASVSKDMMSVIGWSILAILVMVIPTFSALFPGMANNWIKILPSYYLVDSVYRVLNFSAGWREVGVNLLVLSGLAMAFMALGVFSLRRKFR
jgi:ABC-2 type transport system permease protein